ncbi:hypothetical protein [Stygiolobus caldivivus]|uniref:Uncharacterized protein n=1 Tax=Stygiolobus caldivivus TaxID=2824673 RepID=A0A8D5U7H5_9CREN|nr:hypothetical protein [Stygiolobus caldivivus]BCU70209.1 hypothetical protein KN1_15060 [Stygiolobus caldivivus]
MEFIQKRDRLVLTLISQSGPGGIDVNALFSSLSLYMDKESVQRSIGDLYVKGYISILNNGGEIRYFASKQVRDAMIALEVQKYRIASYVNELSKKKDEIVQIQDRSKQIEELRSIVSKGLNLISLGLVSLYSAMPELTIPEYVESIQPLTEVLSRLTKIVEPPYSKDDLENILKIVERFRGEKDYKLLKEIVEKSESVSNENKST